MWCSGRTLERGSLGGSNCSSLPEPNMVSVFLVVVYTAIQSTSGEEMGGGGWQTVECSNGCAWRVVLQCRSLLRGIETGRSLFKWLSAYVCPVRRRCLTFCSITAAQFNSHYFKWLSSSRLFTHLYPTVRQQYTIFFLFIFTFPKSRSFGR